MSGLDSQSGSELVPFCQARGERFLCKDLSHDPAMLEVLNQVGVRVDELDELCRASNDLHYLEVRVSKRYSVCTGNRGEDCAVGVSYKYLGTSEEAARLMDNSVKSLLAERMVLRMWIDIVLYGSWIAWEFFRDAPGFEVARNLTGVALGNALILLVEQKLGGVSRVPGSFLRFMYVRARVGNVFDFIEEPEE